MPNQVSSTVGQQMTNIVVSNFSQFSEDFLRKLFLCLSSEPNEPNSNLGWIFLDILQNKTIEEIARKYIEVDNYNGNCSTSTSSAIFDAFLCYKENRHYEPMDALYLSNRNGSIGSYETYHQNGALQMIFFGAKDLIKELDGEDFFFWLDNLADIGEYEDNIYQYSDLDNSVHNNSVLAITDLQDEYQNVNDFETCNDCQDNDSSNNKSYLDDGSDTEIVDEYD